MNNPFKVFTEKPEIRFESMIELPNVLKEFFGYNLLDFKIKDIDANFFGSEDDYIWFQLPPHRRTPKNHEFMIEITQYGINYWYICNLSGNMHDNSREYIKFNERIEVKSIYSILREVASIISNGDYEFCGFDFNELVK